MRISSNQIHINGVNAILDKQAALAKIQEQISTGRRVTTAADDPVAISTIFNLEQQIGLSDRWIANANNADSIVRQEEVAIFGVENILQRTRELVIQAGNGAFSEVDRNSLAVELEQRLSELVSLANTQINSGEYLFSGFKSDVKPITTDASGNFLYNGDQGQRFIDVGSAVTVATSDSGYDVFFDIKNGNGKFIAAANSSNTGTGIISPGNIFDNTAYVADNYQIDFTVSATGQIQYEVFDSTPASVIGPVNYNDGDEISFNGVSVEISGSPLAGDNFTINPSSRQDIFTTLKDTIAALNTPIISDADSAAQSNKLNLALENIDRAMEKIGQVHSRIGARLNIIENQTAINVDFNLSNIETLSKVRDLDLTTAITDLTQQQVNLEAAQATFVRIQGLSLFNFLR